MSAGVAHAAVSHGTISGYAAGCRQECCKAAHREGEGYRRRQIAYGRWQPFTDPEPARAHVRRLQDERRMTIPDIARSASVAPHIVRYLIHGAPGKGRPSATRIRPEIARRLLAIPDDRNVSIAGDSGYVDGTGTRRRLQALAFMGHADQTLARELGISTARVRKLLHGAGRIRPTTASRVARLYDQLWQLPGTSRPAALTAQARGWVSPLAWEDDEIDDPTARPRGVRHIVTKGRAA